MASPIEKVCEYLRQRKVDEVVIQNFRFEKMDAQAVVNASFENLDDLGLTRTGDKINIMSYCKEVVGGANTEESSDKKRKLLESFLCKKSKLESTKSTKSTSTKVQEVQACKQPQTEKSKKVQFGWLHYDESTRKMKLVRMIKGGGSRNVDMSLESTRDDILQECIKLFFPDGESTFAGKATNMEFGLANFQTEAITSNDIKIENRVVPFSLANYMQANKTSKVRLYLTSREIVAETPEADNGQANNANYVYIDDDDDDDKDLLKSALHPESGESSDGTSHSKTREHRVSARQLTSSGNNDGALMQQSEPVAPTLIGSSEERDIIKTAQDEAYRESLACDRAKDQSRREALEREIRESKQKEALRNTRSLRLPSEPSNDKPSATIQVRHPTLGLVRRQFSTTNKMNSVYDWVGSLSTDPAYFELYSPPRIFLAPNLSVMMADQQSLCMIRCETPPSLDNEVDCAVQFQGFGESVNDSTDTIPDSPMNLCINDQVSHISNHLPRKFMDEDSSDEENQRPPITAVSQERTVRKVGYNKVRKGSRVYGPGQRFREMLNNGTLPFMNNTDSVEITDSENSDSDGGSSGCTRDSTAVPTASNTSGGELADNENQDDEHTISGDENQGDEPGGDENGSTPRDSFSEQVSTRTLRIKRSRVMLDLINEFANDEVMRCTLKVVMVDDHGNDERGIDTGGVYRDAIGCFWQEFYNACTLGEEQRVPTLRHDFQTREWTAIARILVKGYLDMGYFPYMICQAFLISILFGENSVTEDILLDNFKKYVAKDEEQVICEALNGNLGEDENMSELLDLLDRFDCRKLPNMSNIKQIILELAHKELIQKAQYVADSWRDVFQIFFAGKEVSAMTGLLAVYKRVEPTNKKVLNLLNVIPQTNSERASLDYLKRYIRGLDQSQLESFLRYVTGSDVICVTYINIQFSPLDGLARRPIAHTCGAVLELPSTYNSFPELREEFTNILAKKRWQNDIL